MPRAIVISESTVAIINAELGTTLEAPKQNIIKFFFVDHQDPAVLPEMMSAATFFGTYDTHDWRYDTRFVNIWTI